MTISYTAEVATCKRFGCFLKLLFRWRGSIYKLIWLNLLTFLALHYLLGIIYRYIMNDETKSAFEGVVNYCGQFASLIPLSFVLGFYVAMVMTRWWDQYITIPWPDALAVLVSSLVQGQDERGRVMRRTVMRYACLCQTMVFTMISPRVKRRFPNMDHFIDAGLLQENERDVIKAVDESFPKHPKHWMPIVWAASIITRARKEGRIRDDFSVQTIITELNSFRGKCGVLLFYDFISIPLVYTQVVTLAVYAFFLSSVISRQWIDTKTDRKYDNIIDLYIPIFPTLQFFFYMGWLKVGESLINPFGEDDDDFEVNWMVDRNLQMSYLIVDEMHNEHPELVKDQYWDTVFPNELPYANESEVRRDPPEVSTAKLESQLLNAASTVFRSSSRDTRISVTPSQRSMGSRLMSRSDGIHFRPEAWMDSDMEVRELYGTNSRFQQVESEQLVRSSHDYKYAFQHFALRDREDDYVDREFEDEKYDFVDGDDDEEDVEGDEDQDLDAFQELKKNREKERQKRTRIRFLRDVNTVNYVGRPLLQEPGRLVVSQLSVVTSNSSTELYKVESVVKVETITKPDSKDSPEQMEESKEDAPKDGSQKEQRKKDDENQKSKK